MQETIFSDDIKAYKVALVSIPDNKQATDVSFIKNDTRAHAKALFINMLSRATKSVKLKSSMFCKDFYGDQDIYEAFTELNDNIEVKALVEIEDTNVQSGQQDIIERYKQHNNIEINFLNEHNQLNDYLLIDDHSFRYELERFDHKACAGKHLTNVEAVALINADKDDEQRKKVNVLSDFFNKHF